MQKKSCSFQRLTELELKHDLSQKKKKIIQMVVEFFSSWAEWYNDNSFINLQDISKHLTILLTLWISWLKVFKFCFVLFKLYKIFQCTILRRKTEREKREEA